MQVAEGIGAAETDEHRVRQMVTNLLSNAIKFTNQGKVSVSAVCASLDMPSTSSSATRDERSLDAANMLVISVSDTGKGIPADELPTLFDEYRQVAGQSESEVQKGTGLGLSITKKFAGLLGGSIGVESVADQGSTFTIRITVAYVGDTQ